MYQFKISDYYTYDTWGLSLLSYFIGTPQPKYNYVDIPFGNGSIDLTEAIANSVQYSDRTIEATFAMIGDRNTNQNQHSLIKALIHGQKKTIVIPEEENYYYVGRTSIGGLENQNGVNIFDVSMICEPYKYKNDITSVNLTVGTSGTLTHVFANDVMKTVPTFIVSAETQIVFGSYSITVNAGTHQLANVIFQYGNNEVTFNAVDGTTIDVTYQEGAL